MIQIFWSKKLGSYYAVPFEELNISCDNCKLLIDFEDHIFVQKSWGKRDSSKLFLCQGCVKNHRKRIYDEFIICKVSANYPEDSTLVVDNVPQLVSSGRSVSDVAVSNIGIKSDSSSTVEVDNTQLAGRESWEGVGIGIDPELSNQKMLGEKDLLKIEDFKPIDEKRLLE